MVEFKLQLEEDIVRTFGYKEVEYQLQNFIKKMMLKAAAKDILEELEDIDLENDEAWQTARELAWKQEKSKYSM